MMYADITSANVRKLLKTSHTSIRQLAESICVSPSTLTDSLKSKNGISIDMLMRICEKFGVSLNLLCDASFNAAEYSVFLEDYSAYARSYCHLDAHGREVVDAVFRMELSRCLEESTEAIRPVARNGKPIVSYPTREQLRKGDQALSRLLEEGSDKQL